MVTIDPNICVSSPASSSNSFLSCSSSLSLPVSINRSRYRLSFASFRHILIRITKVDHFLRFLNLIKKFSVNKFKKLYQKGKDFIKFFSDTKKILILSRFTIADVLSFSEIQRELDVSSSLLSYDLKKMIDLGFLEKIHLENRLYNQLLIIW